MITRRSGPYFVSHAVGLLLLAVAVASLQHGPAQSVPPADAQEAGTPPLPTRVYGPGGDVLTAPVGDAGLNRRVEALALRLAATEPSRIVSNRGGWQSLKTMHRRGIPEIDELAGQMRAAALDYRALPAIAQKARPAKGAYTPQSPAIEVTEAWVNVVGAGGENVWHSHYRKDTVRASRATPIVGVYYAAVGNSGPSRLLLRDDNKEEFDVTPARGLGAFFPAQMMHAVEPHRNVTGEKPAPRISVSFNLQPRFFSSVAQRAAYDGDLSELKRLVLTESQADQKDYSRDGDGRPLLVTAVEAGHLPAAAYLLGLRADVHARRFNRQGVLHSVASSAGDTSALAAMLLAAGADSALNAPALGGWTPLHHAVAHGSEALVELLLSKDARVDVRNSNGQTPMHTAAAAGRARVVELLLGHGASLRTADKEGREPFHIAAEEGHTEITEMLADRDRDLPWVPITGQRSPDAGSLPIHLAAYRGYLRVLETLGGLDGMLEAKGAGGQTLLHAAVERPRTHVMAWLLEHRADMRAPDDKGLQPLHVAATNGHASAIRLLLGAGADPCEAIADGKCVADLAAAANATEAEGILRERCDAQTARTSPPLIQLV